MKAPRDLAGVCLTAPRLRYELAERPWGSAALHRGHSAMPLKGAWLSLRLHGGESPSPAAAGAEVVSFEMRGFVQDAVALHTNAPPATAWRRLIVDHGLLGRPELVWSGAFPEGWDARLPAPWAGALRSALAALHARYASIVGAPSTERAFQLMECEPCKKAHGLVSPGRVPPRCPHMPYAQRALGELAQVHPELTFELLGWITPAGASFAGTAQPPSRFVLDGQLVEAVLGPWLVDKDLRTLSRYLYGYSRRDPQRRTYRAVPIAAPDLPRASFYPEQREALTLAATAWGLSAPPEVLIVDDGTAPDAAPPPVLEAAALVVDVPQVFPMGEEPVTEEQTPVRARTSPARRAPRKKG